MTELQKFKNIWNDNFETTHYKNTRYIRQTKRGKKTQERYESILFSIWKHHNDWDDDHGFEIKCFRDRTIYRVVKLAVEAGLLIKTRNYYAGDHTNEYHKNMKLFDRVFRGKKNEYGIWLKSSLIDKDTDIINRLLLDEFNNIKSNNNKYNIIPYIDLTLKDDKFKKKAAKLNYDIEKLYNISDKMLAHYYNLLIKLNKSVIHKELEFFTFIKFNKDGFPTGRPYSYFCSTGNDKKQHKDPSIELRSDFLKRIGIPDYFEVFDIKSEVPRVNYLFNTGVWKDNDYDFYTEIIKDTNMMKYLDYEIQRGQTQYTHYNDSMKQIFMRIYFGKGSDEQSYRGYYNDKLKREQNLKDNYYIYKSLQNDYIENLDIWKLVCDSTRKIVGPSIGNLIFWFTFFIETEVKIELLKRGKKVYNVYDGFYFNKDIKDEIIEILNNKAKYVYDKYMKSIKLS
jgi:hypothetical protein